MGSHISIIVSLIALIFSFGVHAGPRYCDSEFDTYPNDSKTIRKGPEPPGRAKQEINVDQTRPQLEFNTDDLFDSSVEAAFECFAEDELYEQYYEPETELNMHCEPMASGYNTPAPINLGCWDNVLAIWASFLYWDASQGNMDIALKSPFSVRNAACGNSFTHGKNVEMDTSYQPGFTIGASHNFICFDNWDISAEYIHLKSRNHRSAEEPADGFLFARWINSSLISNNAVSCLRDSWELDFNVLNVELGRRCYMGTKFIIRPYIGLAAAWIDQKFKGEMGLLIPIPFTLHVDDKSESWALGPRLGVDANWYFTRAFSLVANFAGDILFTHYHIDLHQFATNNSTIFLESSDKDNTLRQELEFFLGLSYEFLDCCYYFGIEAGYDFQIWWNQNMIRWFNDNSFIAAPQGNLYLQGLRVQFKVAF